MTTYICNTSNGRREFVKEGLKNSDLPPVQGCASKIDRDERLILKKAAMAFAAQPALIKPGMAFFQSFLNMTSAIAAKYET